MINSKHGLLIAKCTGQPRDMLRADHPDWNEISIEGSMSTPDTISDLLATIWRGLHGRTGSDLFPRLGESAYGLGVLTKRLRYIVLPVIESPYYLDSFVLTCLVKLGAGTRDIPAWPGLEFKAGEL